MIKAKALTAYLAEREPVPFDWQSANCGHFAGRYVELVEGRDPLQDIVMPTSLREVRKLQRSAGGLAAAISQALSRQPIPPAFAQLGDVVLLPVDDQDAALQALGICCGEHAVCVTADGGITSRAMSGAVSAWRVGG